MQRNKITLTLFFLLFATLKTFSQYPDTTIIQAMTFGGAQDKIIAFPPDTGEYQKILMLYTLKCVPGSSPSCGEWDYLTYTTLFHPTGVMDSSLLTQASFKVNNSYPDSFSFINSNNYSVYPYWQTTLHYTDTTSLTSGVFGNADGFFPEPFFASAPDVRAQYLFKASELSAVVGDTITSLKMTVFNLGVGSDLRNLTVKMKHTTLDSLTATSYENSGFIEVYRANSSFHIDWNTLFLTTPFVWDTTNNIIVEFCFDNLEAGTNTLIAEDSTGWKSGVIWKTPDHFLDFEGADFIDVPSSAFANIDSQITVSFWQYGDPDFQPQDQSSFEGLDQNGFRVINAHVPWSNSRVYWDAGNSGGTSYDRIDKAATVSDIEGQWTHWAFTKDVATGSMRIYKNGVQWHTGSGKTKDMHGIQTFRIGCYGNGSGGFYDGMINEFTIWNTALDAATLQQWIKKDIDASHPFYNNLQVYYKFDETNGTVAVDNSGNGNNGLLNGLPNRINLNDCENIRNAEETDVRAFLDFEQMEGTFVNDSTLIFDTIPNSPVSVVIYNDPINPGNSTDTLIVWNNFNLIFDVNGNLIDTVWTIADSTLYKTQTQYYSEPFEVTEAFEIGRYITPYGIGLSLGSGWKWVFDMTDYEPLLHDSVRIAAGNWQELLDMKFLFIHGTPPREVLRVENVYDVQVGYDANAENILTQKSYTLEPGEETYRMKVRTSGHGFGGNENCSEFCPKTHHISVNNLVDILSDFVWRDNCDLNPLYPQGGTWIYDRTNWCPGAEVWTKDFELTPFVSGDSLMVDYNLQPGYTPGGGGSWAYWDIASQVVFYSDYNFNNDVAIEKIIAPSTQQLNSRYNPICGLPIVMIKNNGENTLTRCDITYGVDGGNDCYYEWTGQLNFGETIQVELPAFDWNGFDPFNPVFHVSVSWPNGVADEHEGNNWAKSNFSFVPEYDSVFILRLQTNLASFENYWKVINDEDSVIYVNGPLANSTMYYDTLHFQPGCYRLEFYDSGEDGLSFFANSDGNGTLRLKLVGGAFFQTFEPDFGGQIIHEFTVGYDMLNSPVKDTCIVPVHDAIAEFSTEFDFDLYPNPTTGRAVMNLNLNHSEDVEMTVTNSLGQIISSQHFNDVSRKSVSIDLSKHSRGIYFISLKTDNGMITKKLILTNN